METIKSYIIDETSRSIREKKPFSEDLFILNDAYLFTKVLDIILTNSQQLQFYSDRVTFKISDKKINEALEFISASS